MRRGVLAFAIAFALLLCPVAPLIAFDVQSCDEMPCCKGEHASCHRMSHSGPGWNGLPSCGEQCRRSPGTIDTLPTLLANVSQQQATPVPVSLILPRPEMPFLSNGKDFHLYQRPPPASL